MKEGDTKVKNPNSELNSYITWAKSYYRQLEKMIPVEREKELKEIRNKHKGRQHQR